MRVRGNFMRFLFAAGLLKFSILLNVDGGIFRKRFSFFGLLAFANVRTNVTINCRLLGKEILWRFNYIFRDAYRNVRANSIYRRSVLRINKITADLNVRIYAAVTRAAIASGLRRDLGRFRIISERLINVPTVLMIATINVSEARRTNVCDADRFVFRDISNRNNIICFSVCLGIFIRTVYARRTSGNLDVCIMLIFNQFRKLQFGGRYSNRAVNAYVITYNF